MFTTVLFSVLAFTGYARSEDHLRIICSHSSRNAIKVYSHRFRLIRLILVRRRTCPQIGRFLTHRSPSVIYSFVSQCGRQLRSASPPSVVVLASSDIPRHNRIACVLLARFLPVVSSLLTIPGLQLTDPWPVLPLQKSVGTKLVASVFVLSRTYKHRPYNSFDDNDQDEAMLFTRTPNPMPRPSFKRHLGQVGYRGQGHGKNIWISYKSPFNQEQTT